MRHPFFRRRKILIKPSYQLRSALTVILFLVIYSLILGFLIFYPIQQELSTGASLEEQARVSHQVLQLHKRVWPGVLIVAILVGIQAIFASHRIAGPLYRVEKALEDLIAGDFKQRIRLRRRDQFREFEGLINQLAEHLEQTSLQDQRFHTALKTRLETISSLLQEGGPSYEKARDLLEELIVEVGAHPGAFSPSKGSTLPDL
ncbi:MAG: methyl-accepting chemotaxis protein [candidate division NC10 bacterium]|nr:methyl-accepting chemotaxis protein [candidate division NC10 bacterium]